MTLGEKIRQARLSAGLSQRMLCGDMITRNMLSLIEHDSAQPSMDTLQYLAGQLGKPVSYFLDETAVISPNLDTMDQLRAAWETRDLPQALSLLHQVKLPDPVIQWEFSFLQAVITHAAVQEALSQGREGYARELMEALPEPPLPEVKRQHLLLKARLPGEDLTRIAAQLPSLDAELQFRARAALEAEDHIRAAALLEAAEEKDDPSWCLLRGKTWLAAGNYREASRLLLLAEDTFPRQTIPLLETCFRELGDYRQAYLYACRRLGGLYEKR